MERHIIHVDMDAFYASVEQRDRPELAGKCIIVGGTGGRGVVCAASYPAREFGVHSAMPMATAMRLCPQAIVLPVRMERYAEISGQIHHIFQQITGRIEPISCDEAFLDVTQRVPLAGSVEAIGREIKTNIKRLTGLTASVGMAPNKFLAKLASDLEKPDGFVRITEDNKLAVLAPLDVQKIWGVGAVTAAALKSRGLVTIGDLQRQSVERLHAVVGRDAQWLWDLAHGIDDRPVESEHEAKNLSQEHTFAVDQGDPDVLRAVLYEQVQHVARRLRAANLTARTVQLKLRDGQFRTITRRATLGQATDATEELWAAAAEILSTWAGRRPVPLRLIGFGVANLSDEEKRQLTLFDEPGHERARTLDRTIDAIREKFGDDTLKRGF